jgi:thiamine-phosphate diphosphorylase
MVALGKELRTVTQRFNALLIVNDRVDVALAIEADGVHLGDDDLPPEIARRITPPHFLIGASADTPAEAAAAERAGLDYVGIGPVYSTGTKVDTGSVIGLEGVRKARETVSLPLVGIGGIAPERAKDVIEAGADAVAVVGAVMFAVEPGDAATAMLRAIEDGLRARGARY